MFNQLTSRFQQAFRNLTGRGRLTESNISDAMAEIRRALLEADVNYEVVKSFIDSVREQSLGADVMKSVTPGQQVVKIVNDKLIELLGQNTAPLNVGGKPPALIMLCGLHGSGKTTTSAKLALHIKDIYPNVLQEGREKEWTYAEFSKHGIFAELGEGMVDFPAMFDILSKAGFDGWVIVETDVTTKSSALESATISRKYLQSIGL